MNAYEQILIDKDKEIIKLQAECIALLEKDLHMIQRHNNQQHTKPLTDEEIQKIADNCLEGATAWHNPDLNIFKFARAIEAKIRGEG